MAVTDVAICKLALSHLGEEYNIESLSEGSTESDLCSLLYDPIRKLVLRMHPWGFAGKFTEPAALAGTPPASWAYMYTYPTDAIIVRRLMAATGHQITTVISGVDAVSPINTRFGPVRYLIRLNDSDVKVILTDLEDPIVEYTKDVENTVDFDPEFDMALSYMLAAKMAIPLTGDRELMADMFSLSRASMGGAEESDASEEVEPEKPDADWLIARA